jgi:hypothetical protein
MEKKWVRVIIIILLCGAIMDVGNNFITGLIGNLLVLFAFCAMCYGIWATVTAKKH